MQGKTNKPDNAAIITVCKFLGSALFGGLISLGVYLTVTWLNDDAFTRPTEIHILWIIPLVWGILGVFFFDLMLDIAKKVIGVFLDVFH